MVARLPKPGLADLFAPKLLTVLREGYGWRDLRADAVAGLTVAIVALPLSMAIAIASGVSPERGLHTAIVGGFLVSLLGGSRFQIGGPAGAFIVLVAATVQRHGLDGLILATFLSGLILVAAGLLRLGVFVKYIPYPVTVGFTAGIAVIIFVSQISGLFGLTVPGGEPGELLAKLAALWRAAPTVNAQAAGVAAAAIALIVLIRRYRPAWPVLLIAVAVTTGASALLNLEVATIGSQFGGIAQSLPWPTLPDLSPARVVEVLPAAVSFALLGAIESLLSAVVADSMSGRRHRSNAELIAQGVANVGSSLVGGFCVTGTIARTATNVRSGARGPVSGMLHALYLLAFLLIAAPLAAYIPLAALAAVLATVAWNMAEKHAVGILLRTSRADAAVLTVTFLLTIFRDLSTGIVVGFSLAALLFLHRMARSIEVDTSTAAPGWEEGGEESPIAPVERDILVYRISGAFFFGAAAGVAAALDRTGEQPRAYVVDFSEVPVLDSTAAATVSAFARKAADRGAGVHLVAASADVRRILRLGGVGSPPAHYHATLERAVASARKELRSGGSDRTF